MPGYAPVLSDHLALFMATLALWAWMRRLRWLLALLVTASFWVLPGLFVLPAALLALPFDARRVAGEHGRSRRVFWITCAGLLLALVWVWLVAAGVPAAVIDHHPPGTTLGKSALRPLTLLLIGVALAASALIGARLLSAQTFWRSLCPHGVAGALLLALLGGATVWFGLDWGGGHQGPPLHHHLLLQGLAAPAKPLVAHFVYFGPLFVLAVAALACRLDDLLEGGLAAPAAVCVAFLPLLMFASESRQWIWLLPVMALLTAATARTCALWWQLVFSLALLVPALWLRTATQADDAPTRACSPMAGSCISADWAHGWETGSTWPAAHCWCFSCWAWRALAHGGGAVGVAGGHGDATAVLDVLLEGLDLFLGRYGLRRRGAH